MDTRIWEETFILETSPTKLDASQRESYGWAFFNVCLRVFLFTTLLTAETTLALSKALSLALSLS